MYQIKNMQLFQHNFQLPLFSEQKNVVFEAKKNNKMQGYLTLQYVTSNYLGDLSKENENT